MLQRSLIRRFSSKVEPRAFEEIPGPKALPLIGTLYKYLPLIGEYDMKKLHKNGAAKYAEYGPLVREEIVLGEPIVWVFRPEDIAEVFKADTGRYPERRSHRALFKYRLDRRWIYNSGGLLPTNGPDWWRLRKEFQKALSRPRNVVNYAEDTDEIVRRFVSVCEDGRFDDALPLLSRLFLELTCLVAFDLKIDAFSEREMLRDSMSSRLVDAAFTTNSVILRLDNGPRLWRFFDTPKYRKLCRAQAYMEEVAVKMVSEKLEKLKDEAPNEKQSLLEIYLQNPELDFKDVVGMACDMLLAGIDTTTYSSAFALYHLSRNPETLDKLHAEASRLIPDDSCVVTAETLKSAIYTKAVIKETFRLNPISVGVGRILQTDVVLNGYHVRKGVRIMLSFDYSTTFIGCVRLIADERSYAKSNLLPTSGVLREARQLYAGAMVARDRKKRETADSSVPRASFRSRAAFLHSSPTRRTEHADFTAQDVSPAKIRLGRRRTRRGFLSDQQTERSDKTKLLCAL